MIQRLFLVLLASLALPVFAQGATEASVERLFAAMNVERSIGATYAMMDNMMKQSMAQALPANPTPQQAKAAEAARAGFSAVMRDELSWEKMKPDLVKTYSETFTEAEVLGIVAFYESPAGQAFVNKMPLLMQKSMASTQERMRLLIPRMKAAVEKAALEAKAQETH
jgi:hypothetical protein